MATGWVVSRDGVFDEASEGEILSETAPLAPREGDLGLEFTERQGFPAITTMFQGKLYYIPETDADTGTPQVRVWDGTTDAEFYRVPDSTDITGIEVLFLGSTPYLVVQTLDTLSPLEGRVFAVNLATRAGTLLGGGPLPEGYLPFGVTVFAGIVCVATYTNDADANTAGRVYVTNPTPGQPGYNVWTLGLTATGFGGFTGCRGFTFGVEGPSGTFATIGAIESISTTTGAITLHGTAAASGGTAAAGNAFLSSEKFKGNDYVSYWNPDTTPISKVYRLGFDEDTETTTLTQVWEAGGTASLQKPINLLFTPDNEVLYGLMGGDGDGGLISTTDGTNWTDRSSTLPDDCPPLSKAAGGKITRTS